ncbi:hypothetical protein P5G62_009945 [Neobacillus sp. 179-C4.2 HS]|uniref:Uncharacterized protein n=1 Tax=Neobacillus driksii TaxID=3035913 RepID=A0ABV4YRE3_9BACI|nr:hypothetical protein [Neobacillus sp. 179.-C4.2 HS]MDP5195004.1 hypothetical protein [Neobacillus sp. 179.-C4.2 HS]
MGKLFAIIGAIAYYLCYPFLLIMIILGPIMEFPVLLEIYRLETPRAGMTISVMSFLGILLFLSYKYPRLGWLYRKFPVLVPLLQMFFLTLAGIEFAIFFANLWADKLLYSKEVAILLSVLSVLIVRIYLSYWYRKYPISYKVHKL